MRPYRANRFIAKLKTIDKLLYLFSDDNLGSWRDILSEHVDCIVIGAGVIGLAVARELQLSGRDVVLLEKANAVGTETSSRNSEVIHAGIYYPERSLKAELCVLGRKMLYEYCIDRSVSVQRYGKLIVATDESQVSRLNKIYAQGHKNGVDDLQIVDAKTLDILYPELNGVAAIKSPSTGVVNSHELMLSLLGDFENAGGTLALNSPVTGGEITDNKVTVHINCVPKMSLTADTVINCAGLWATEIAHSIVGMPPTHIPKTYYAKGSYFAYDGKTPFDTLVYPIPFVGGLGIHLTLDMTGAARFGPDIEWTEHIDYNVNDAAHENFVRSIRTYWPSVDPSKLHTSYAGVRPKIVPPSIGDQDYLISTPVVHGVKGLYHLFGFDSPGLTSCLSIAHHLNNLIMARSA